MADQGIPFPLLGSHSQMSMVADNAHVQNQPIDDYIEGDLTEARGMRASGTRTAKKVTPKNQDASPSTPVLSGLPVGH
ncbi:hypothetical protein Hanom_Chr15g01365711 [Helianthus anomalus]